MSDFRYYLESSDVKFSRQLEYAWKVFSRGFTPHFKLSRRYVVISQSPEVTCKSAESQRIAYEDIKFKLYAYFAHISLYFVKPNLIEWKKIK